ncbi:Uncharacterised protein [uncultured archaeon]|nr:Uncharacterised protein [uncultured archaeon]
MGKHAPSNRDNELRVEKLFFRKGLTEKFDSGELVDLGGFVSFLWHDHPSYVSDICLMFLRELVAYRRAGKSFTQDDWARFSSKVSHSRSSRDVMLYKLMYLGLVEKVGKSKMQYEIRLSDKFLEYLEYLAQSWVLICENEPKG